MDTKIACWLKSHQYVASWSTLCGVLGILYFLADGGA